MEPIEARAAELGRWYTNAKGTRVKVTEIRTDGVTVEKGPGQTTTVPLTYPLTPEPAAPAQAQAAAVKASDLAGKPKATVEPVLAGLATEELRALVKLDSRIWLGVAVEKLLAGRTAAACEPDHAPADAQAPAPPPPTAKAPEGWCLICGSEVGVRKPMTVKGHLGEDSIACPGQGTRGLDHPPTEADRLEEDEVGEKAWREGRSIPDIDDEGRPRPLAAAGWTRARSYWMGLLPEPKIRLAPTEALGLEALRAYRGFLDNAALRRLLDDVEMESPARPALMEALRQQMASLAATDAIVGWMATVPTEDGGAGAADPVLAQDSQAPASDPPGPLAEEVAANAATPGPESAPPAAPEFPPPLAQDDPKYLRVLNWMDRKNYRVTTGRPMPGSTTDRRIRVIAAVQAKLAEAKLVLQHPDARADTEMLRRAAEYEVEQGARRAGLVSWIERQTGPLEAGRTTVTIAEGDLAAAAAALLAPPAGPPPFPDLAGPDRAAVEGFQSLLGSLQKVMQALSEVAPYVVAANALCEQARDLGFQVTIDDLVACRVGKHNA